MAEKDSIRPAGTTLNDQSGFALSFWNGTGFETRWYTIAQMKTLLLHWDQDSNDVWTAEQRNLRPLNDNLQDLGTETIMWKDLYVKGKILSDTTFQISTERTIPTPNLNSNWAADGSTYLGAWNSGLTPTFGDLVDWSGTLYANNSGSNSLVDPVADGGANWEVYASPFVGAWSAGGTFAQYDIVSYGGTVYTHVSTNQEVFKHLYFDGTAFYFGSNTGNWLKVDATKIVAPRLESPSGVLNIAATSSIAESAPVIELGATTYLKLTASGFVFLGANNNDELLVYDNTSGNAVTSATSKRAVIIGSEISTTIQGNYNTVIIGGAGAIITHRGEIAFGNATNAQSGKLSYFVHTSDATPTEAQLNNIASMYFTIDSGCAYYITVKGMATNQVTGESATYSGEGIIKNVAGTTSLTGGTITQTAAEGTMSTTDLAVTADDTNDRLAVTVTGNGGTDIRWNVVIDYLKIKFT